jgi:hypothetical protein
MAINITQLSEPRRAAPDRAPRPGELEESGAIECLCYQILEHRKVAKRKFIAAQVLVVVAVTASVLGAVNPATGWLAHDAWTSVLAAVPGIVLLIMHVFNYNPRSEWHRRTQRSLEALYRGLVFERRSTHEISALLTAISEGVKSSRGRAQASKHQNRTNSF